MEHFFSGRYTRGLPVFFFLGMLFLFSLPVYSQTPDIKISAAEIISILEEKNIPFEVRPLLQDYGGFGASVHVYPVSLHTARDGFGELSARGTFVLAVPVDSSFAAETALAFIDAARARLIQENSDTDPLFQKDLLVAFLGDEKSFLDNADFSNKGLRDLISLPSMPETWTVCYFECPDPPGSIRISHGSGEYIAPLELVKPLPPLFKSCEIPFTFEARYNELYKLDICRGSDELALLWSGEIYGICFYPGIEGSDANKIDSKKMAELLLEYAENLQLPLEKPDQHYSFITLPFGPVFFVSETALLIILITGSACLFTGLLFYSALYRIKVISRIRLFLKRGWVFIIFLPLMVLIVRGVGLFYGFLYDFLKIPVPNVDFWGIILIVFLAIWLFNIISHGLDYFHFPRKSRLYGISAVIIAGTGVLSSAALDLTYIVIFLWSFIFCFMGSALKKPKLIFVSALLIPLRTLGAFYNIYESGGIPVRLFVIQGNYDILYPVNWITAFQIALLCLPIMLILKRAMILEKQKNHVQPSREFYKAEYHKNFKISFMLRIGILCLLLAIIALKTMFFSERPEQIRRIFSADSPEIPGDKFSVILTETVFEESCIVNVKLQTIPDPLMFDLLLMDPENELLLIYSSTVPFERETDNSVRFILGENPPNPLNLEIVLKDENRGVFYAQAFFNKWDSALDPLPPPQTDTADYLLTLQSRPVPLTR